MPTVRTKRALAGYATSIAQYITQFALQAFVTPLILFLAGREVLGAYAIIYQALNYLALVDLGYAQSLERFLAQCHGRLDGDQTFKDIFSAFRAFLFFSNLIFAILVVLLATFLPRMFPISGSLLHQARVGLYCIATWAVIRTPFAAFTSALVSTQNLAIVNVTTTATNALRVVLSFVFLKLHFALLGLMWASLIAEMFGTLVSAILFYRRYPNRVPSWNTNLFAAVRRTSGLLSYSLNTFVVQLAALMAFNSAALFAGFFLGPVGASILYTTQLPSLVTFNIIYRLHDNFGPALNEMWGTDERTGFIKSFRDLTSASVILGTVATIGILLFNQRAITAWVGAAQYAGTAATLALAASAVFFVLDHLFTQGVLVIGDAAFAARLAGFQLVFYLPLVLILGHFYGIPGILFAGPISDLPKTILLGLRVNRGAGINIGSALKLPGSFLFAIAASVGAVLLFFRTVGTQHTILNLACGVLLFAAVLLGFGFNSILKPFVLASKRLSTATGDA